MPYLIILFLIGGIVSAHAGTFYTTGQQFYEGCWERQKAEAEDWTRALREAETWKPATAKTASEAALWASCSRIVAETMDNVGFAIADSRPTAPAERQALVGFCPNAFSELPQNPDALYVPIIETIERMGGPSTTESFAPASWIIERALVARWPRCIDTARPYLAKARKSAK
jgi:hypothetical protein